MSTQQILNPYSVPVFRPVFTTGGLYTLAVRLLSETGIPIHLTGRFFSFFNLCALLVLINHIAKKHLRLTYARLIILTMALAAPGSIFLGGMAYGITCATFLFLASVYFWINAPSNLLIRWLLPGIGLGLAAATRATFIPLLPILLFWSLTTGEKRKNYLKPALLSTILAVIVFLVFLGVHVYLMNTSLVLEIGHLRSMNANHLLPRPPRLLSFLVKGFLFIPLPFLLASLYLSWKKSIKDLTVKDCLLQILTLASLMLCVLWMTRSPFQHIRYVWPAILFLYIVVGFYLAQLYEWIRESHFSPSLLNLCLIVPIGMVVTSIFGTIRLVALGAGMQTNSAGLESLENHFKAFYLIQEQNQIVRYLKNNTLETDVIIALHLPAEWSQMQLSLLAKRQLHTFQEWKEKRLQPSLIVTHKFSSISAEGEEWLNNNCSIVQELFGYKIYSLIQEVNKAPEIDMQIDFQLTRFGLPRELSLSLY